MQQGEPGNRVPLLLLNVRRMTDTTSRVPTGFYPSSVRTRLGGIYAARRINGPFTNGPFR